MLRRLWLLLFLISSSLAQTYTDLHDFDCSTEGCASYWSGVLAQGRDGNLYGTLPAGGNHGYGTVFRSSISGATTTLYNFDLVTGSLPTGGLTLGTDGRFYGTTQEGGANNLGTIFRIAPTGTASLLYSFAAPGKPWVPPIQGHDGSYYGLSLSQAYRLSASGAYKLLSNTSVDSVAPLIQAADGYFYGVSYSDGSCASGTIFRVSASGVVMVIHVFCGIDGQNPTGLVEGKDGYLYGTALRGGTQAGGVVFRLSTDGSNFSVLYDFENVNYVKGRMPFSGLLAATDGNLYGATGYGGMFDSGVLFRITTTGGYTVLHDFNYSDGNLPFSTATQHTNGRIYGLSRLGGAYGGGVLYSLDVGLPPFVSLLSSSGKAGKVIQILGTGLKGTTAVSFGMGSALFRVVSDTYMTATVPVTGTTGSVRVTTPSGTRVSNRQFNIIPVIQSFTPATGVIGTPIVITGTGLTDTTKVTFGDQPAAFTVDSATQVTAIIPIGAKTGTVILTAPGGKAAGVGKFVVD